MSIDIAVHEANMKARAEARKRFRESAEAAFKTFKSEVEEFLSSKGKIQSFMTWSLDPPAERTLQGIKSDFQDSDIDAVGLQKISKELELLGQHVEVFIPSLLEIIEEPDPEKRSQYSEKDWKIVQNHYPRYPKEEAKELLESLQNAHWAFLRMAAHWELLASDWGLLARELK